MVFRVSGKTRVCSVGVDSGSLGPEVRLENLF